MQLQAIQVLNGHNTANEPIEIQLNTMCGTIWEDNICTIWYTGYCTGYDTDHINVDHLQRVDTFSDLGWKYPTIVVSTSKDENEINNDNILTWDVDGIWDYKSICNATLTLKINRTIYKMFHSAVLYYDMLYV